MPAGVSGIDGVWKMVATGLLGAVLGGAPGYFLIGPEKVSREDVVEIITKYSPYVEDRKVIFTTIKENQSSIKDMRPVLEKINVSIAETNSKIDYIIKNIR
jgi:hypothetical protein|tara:strand:+ start:812 stop:1114 length:303 start_codon:yes stop_codon:yes gene_type:complete